MAALTCSPMESRRRTGCWRRHHCRFAGDSLLHWVYPDLLGDAGAGIAIGSMVNLPPSATQLQPQQATFTFTGGVLSFDADGTGTDYENVTVATFSAVGGVVPTITAGDITIAS